MRQLSDKLQRLRRKAGVSQSEIAARLGVTRQTVGNWEASTRHVDIEKLERYAGVLGYDVLVTFVAKEDSDESELEELKTEFVGAVPTTSNMRRAVGHLRRLYSLDPRDIRHIKRAVDVFFDAPREQQRMAVAAFKAVVEV